MKEAKVIDPSRQEDRARIWFGATITLADEDGSERVLTLVGEDEAAAEAGKISWYSPFARAMRGAAVGEVRAVALPGGAKDYEVIAIDYRD
jgi:transcription elongation factor GreB